MRILHISDFHYMSKAKAEFDRVVEKMVDSLKTQDKIDVIVFSGDLIHKDASVDLFNEAAECLFTPVFEATGLDKNRLLLCPGNHDLSLKDELPIVSSSLNGMNTAKLLDDFCNTSQQLDLSLTRFSEYNAFVSDYFETAVNSEPMYDWFEREINGKKVGLVAFNSAWRCVKSEQDRGNLLYPVRYVHEALDKVKNCDMVLCNMHHNISDFKFFIEKDIEDVICDRCHILFTGHYHKGKLSVLLSPNGMLHSTANATFNRHESGSEYGYLIIEIDDDSFDVKATPFRFVNNQFVDLETVSTVLPMSEAKREANAFRKLMRDHLDYYREKADNLFVKGKSEGAEGHTFQTLFIDPIIKDKTFQEMLATRRMGKRISIKDIEEDTKTVLLFGRGKSGRTSLLYRIMLDFLSNYANSKIIPYYIPYKEVDQRESSLGLEKHLRQYLGLNKNKTIEKFKTYTLLLLVDDLDLKDTLFLKKLGDEMAVFDNVRIIATAEETLAEQTLLTFFANDKTKTYFIHEVTSREVHQLTLRWPNMPVDKKRRYEEKIVSILRQMHMPFNYWTVSLFLWIFETTDPSNIHNNFELVNLYIDEILDKPGIILNKNFTIDYDDLRSYLAAFAEFLLGKKNHRVDYGSLVKFTDDYRETHKKFTEQTRDVLNLMFNQGVFVQEKPLDGGDDLFTFRLNGIFEYFIALRLKENPELKDKILKDDCSYFSFGTEFELYSGFEKDDLDTVKDVLRKTRKIMKPISDMEEYNRIDERLVQEIVIDQDGILPAKIVNHISEAAKDDIEDLLPVLNIPFNESKVTPKTLLAEIPATLENIEKALFILSRMYRNSNACNDTTLSDEILDFVLTGVCNMGFMLPEDAKKFNLDKEDYKEYVQLVSNIMPIMVETYFYDAISQMNLVRVFDEKLKQLKQNPVGNQFKIFIMTFIIVDLNPKANIHYIDEALPYLSNRVLRFTFANKLMLLMLNDTQDKDFINQLKPKTVSILKDYKTYKNIENTLDKELTNRSLKDQTIKAIDAKDYNY